MFYNKIVFLLLLFMYFGWYGNLKFPDSNELVPVTVMSLDTSVVSDVTARRLKMHGEFVSLKQRPMTSCAVSYRIELAIDKIFMPG